MLTLVPKIVLVLLSIISLFDGVSAGRFTGHKEVCNNITRLHFHPSMVSNHTTVKVILCINW